MRTSTMKRTTKETAITVALNLDGNRKISIDTGIPFFDHMLEAMAFYADFDLTIKAVGDLVIDDHHTVEDVGIVLGQAFKEALGDKVGIRRFADNVTPMDEALSRVALDISNRPVLVFTNPFTRETLGTLSTETIKEFFYAFTINAAVTLHIANLYGENDHHKAESIFKGVGRALNQAVELVDNTLPSTKGSLV